MSVGACTSYEYHGHTFRNMLLGCVTQVEVFCIIMTGSYFCISSLPLYLTSSVDRSFLVRRQWWRGGTASSIHLGLHLPCSNVLMYFAGMIFVEPSLIAQSDKTPNDLYISVEAQEEQLPEKSNGASWYTFLKERLRVFRGAKESSLGNSNPEEEAKAAITKLDSGDYVAYMRGWDGKWVHLQKDGETEFTKLPTKFEFFVVPKEGERS
eukprot:GHVU01196935.1.p1 GENE.GHVU01196935.1~~GHVU01196935.1.p1  ORF type:complete len:209 (-),score=19.02 GHVU01196935.1:235-861(-)